jgi:hypothetical protein
LLEAGYEGSVVPVIRHFELFDISDVVEILRANDQKLEFKITVVEDESGLMICDGSSRVVGCYEWALKHNCPEISVPVFLITVSKETG